MLAANILKSLTMCLQKLCDIVCELLLEESNVQPVHSPVTVCGDIHGQVRTTSTQPRHSMWRYTWSGTYNQYTAPSQYEEIYLVRYVRPVHSPVTVCGDIHGQVRTTSTQPSHSMWRYTWSGTYNQYTTLSQYVEIYMVRYVQPVHSQVTVCGDIHGQVRMTSTKPCHSMWRYTWSGTYDQYTAPLQYVEIYMVRYVQPGHGPITVCGDVHG